MAVHLFFCYNNLMDLILFQQFGIAILLGSLIGLEREHRQQVYGYEIFGGLRTFALISLSGALAMFLSNYSAVLSGIVTVALFTIIIFSYFNASKNHGKVGVTSEIAAVVAYMIGILCGMDNFLLATCIAIATLAILHFKQPLHKWAHHIKNEEIVSTIQFIVITFIILPLLPNKGFGPYEFFNPYVVWLIVVFISGISFASYIAIKLFGAKRGIGLTGFLAGLISSTALTLSFSGQSKKNKTIVDPYVVAIVVASSAMFFRVLLEVAVLNRELLATLVLPMTVMGGVGILSALFFWFRDRKLPEEAQKHFQSMKSPFRLSPALQFGLFFALILFLVKFSESVIGDKGLYMTSVLSGVLDVDAITVSVSTLAKSEMAKLSATYAIIIATMVNTVAKGMIVLFLGNRKVAVKILAVFALMLVAGGISLLFLG